MGKKGARRKTWTKQEEKKLIQLWGKTDICSLKKMFDVTENAVRNKYSILMKKAMEKIPMEEEEDFIASLGYTKGALGGAYKGLRLYERDFILERVKEEGLNVENARIIIGRITGGKIYGNSEIR